MLVLAIPQSFHKYHCIADSNYLEWMTEWMKYDIMEYRVRISNMTQILKQMEQF